MEVLKKDKLTGFYLKAKTASALGTIFLYHGWSSSAERQLFRGELMSLYGYDVILVDSLYHGKRGTLDYDDPKVFVDHFFEVLNQNILDFPKVYQLAESVGAELRRVIVMGHSLGGYTSGGLLANYDQVSEAVLFNGSMDWKKSFLRMKAIFDVQISPEEVLALNFSPMDKAIDFNQKRLFLANGKNDETVYAKENEIYVDDLALKSLNLFFKIYKETGHVITDTMLYDALSFLGVSREFSEVF